jgi:hypothetical protein
MLYNITHPDRLEEWNTICNLANHRLQEWIELYKIQHNTCIVEIVTACAPGSSVVNQYLLIFTFILKNTKIHVHYRLCSYSEEQDKLIIVTTDKRLLPETGRMSVIDKIPLNTFIVDNDQSIHDTLLDFYKSNM